MATCTIEHWRGGECIEKWNVTEGMIQREGDTARVVFPAGHVEMASFDELHFCISDAMGVLQEVKR